MTSTLNSGLGLGSGVKTWSGEIKDWAIWKFQMANLMRRHDPLQMSNLLQTAENRTTEIDMSGLDEDARIISASVMSDLAIKTSDKALRIGSLETSMQTGRRRLRIIQEAGTSFGNLEV